MRIFVLLFALSLMGIYNANGNGPDFSHPAFQRFYFGSGLRNNSVHCYDFGYEYKTANLINPIENFKGGPKACKNRCSRTQGCKAFTWIRLSVHKRDCILKMNDSYKILNPKAVSGTISACCKSSILLLRHSPAILIIIFNILYKHCTFTYPFTAFAVIR